MTPRISQGQVRLTTKAILDNERYRGIISGISGDIVNLLE